MQIASLSQLAATMLAFKTASAIAPSTNLPPSWSYLGCYADNVSNRTLKYASYSDKTDQTGQSCVDFCGANGYPYAGTGIFLKSSPRFRSRVY